MASIGTAEPNPGRHTQSPRDWQEMVHLVNTSFDNIIDKVNKRRVKVLTLIKELEEKETDLYKSIKKVDDMKHILEEQMIDNLVASFREKSITDFNDKLSELRKGADIFADYIFVFDEKEIDKALSTLGGIELRAKHYLGKGVPKLSFGNSPDNPNKHPRRLSFDEELDMIAITSTHDKKVFLYSMKGDFIQSFGEDYFEQPYAIKIISKTELFVSDFIHKTICRIEFERSRTKKQKITYTPVVSGYEYITSIDYDKESILFYATCSTSHCVLIFTREGKIKSKILESLIIFPQDLFLTKHEIYVLDQQNPTLHIFSKSSHEILRSIIPSGIGLNHEVSQCFTLDQDGNILLVKVHSSLNLVHIYSPSGQLLHSFSKKGNGLGELMNPTSISVTQNNDIIILSQNPDYPIQIF